MQMNKGRYGVELKKQLFSEEVHEAMWAPQTIIPVGGTTTYNTHFASYGLGWFLSDVSGYKQVGLQIIGIERADIRIDRLGDVIFAQLRAGCLNVDDESDLIGF